MMQPRILITGSRDWDNAHVIESTLWSWWFRNGKRRDIQLVHGDANGADIIAGLFWEAQFGPEMVKAVPANWNALGKRAGSVRNQLMVDMRPYLQAFAFPLGGPGTADCMERIRQADIPLWVYGIDVKPNPTAPFDRMKVT